MSHVRRRRFLIASGALFAAPLLRAQQTGRTYRVAVVLTTSPIAEMAGPNPEHPVTRAIPIVLMGWSTAVEDGFAASLARPGGNITGFAEHPQAVFRGKQLQLFKETVPGLSRVVFLGPTLNLDSAAARPFTDAAKALGIKLLPVLEHPTDPVASFAAIAKLRPDGLMIAPSSTAFAQREQLGRLALAARLPAISSYEQMTETGGLMSYAGAPRFSRIAHYVDKILKGANPGELPMELPTHFNLVINLKTAKVLGLKIPPSILLQADRVIE